MSEKLERLSRELEKAKEKRASLDRKIKDLEARYLEQENTEIHDMVREAQLSPETLAELIARSRRALPQTRGNRLEEFEEMEETDDEE